VWNTKRNFKIEAPGCDYEYFSRQVALTKKFRRKTYLHLQDRIITKLEVAHSPETLLLEFKNIYRFTFKQEIITSSA
jgi:hypothetical protein